MIERLLRVAAAARAASPASPPSWTVDIVAVIADAERYQFIKGNPAWFATVAQYTDDAELDAVVDYARGATPA